MKPKYSPEILDLEKRMRHCAALRQYKEAKRVSQKIEELKREQLLRMHNEHAER